MVDRKQLDALRADKGRLIAALTEAGATFQADKVRCPFHDDSHPSAGVYEIDGGWRFTCQACEWNRGKRTGDVLDVVRTFHKLDFAAACSKLGVTGNGQAPRRVNDGSNGRGNPPATSPDSRAIERNAPDVTVGTPQNEIDAPSPFPTVEAFAATLGTRHGGTWTYANLDGSPAMAVVRVNEPKPDDPGAKRFLPLHPTPAGWILGDPPGKLPLYRLPELAAAECVCICEGEKSADAARTIGLVATTSSHGSGSAEKTDWTPLAGKRVVVLPDNDDAGRTYAKAVARILGGLTPPAAVRVVELPGLPPKGDIVEYIDARECVDSCDIRARIEALGDPWAGTRIGDILRAPKTWAPKTYIRTGLSWLDARLCGGFRTGGISLLCGKTGQGKTQLAVTIAGNAARAGIPVGFLSLELGAEEIVQLITAQVSGVPRLKLATGNLNDSDAAALRKTIGDCGDIPLTILDDDFWPGGLDRDRLAALVGEGCKRFGWRLVVLDYLGLLVPSEIDRDQYDTDLRHSAELKRLARKNDVAILVVGAVRKGATFRTIEAMTIDDVLGAGRIAYDAQTVLGVGCEHGDADSGLVKVRDFKMRFAPCDQNADPVQLRWRPRCGAIVDLLPGEAPHVVNPIGTGKPGGKRDKKKPVVEAEPESGGEDDLDLDEEARQVQEILAADGGVAF